MNKSAAPELHTKAAAVALAQRLVEYWRTQGREVRAWVEAADFQYKADHSPDTFYVVRSNIGQKAVR